MLVSYKWICEIAGIHPTPEELAERLTFSGLEIEGITHVGAELDRIVVGQIRSKTAHPSRDKLSVVEVDSGSQVHQVVCGASNCPGPGGRVVFAMPGAVVGDVTIEPRPLAGVDSHGMICSEMELDIGPDHEGILILDGETDTAPGTPIAQALDLEDWILEVGITPNRPDALSHRGIARDAALLYGKPFAPPRPSSIPQGTVSVDQLAAAEIADPDRCPRYGAAVVRGVTVARSPFPIRYRLHTLGIRPISNLVDITNIIVLEYGQPLHAFDLDLVADSKILVRKARQGEKLRTLDLMDRDLLEDDLLICDGQRPVALAGVMGGADSGITEKTENVLIECAYFEPSGIRRTSKRLKLSSESSYRFERGIDPNMGPEVLEAAAALTVALAGGTMAPGLIDCYPSRIEPQVVSLRPDRFTKIMGFAVEPREMRRILEGLGAAVGGDDARLEVTVPTFRPDIEREIDLIEEVARIRGLKEIPSNLPRIRCTIPHRPAFESARRAKEILAAIGLEEAVNYSFVPDELLRAFGRDENVIPIANPLSAERRAMRTTLLAGLLENLKRAHSRFLPGISQFEVARTFHDVKEELPEEVLRAAAVISGPAKGWIGSEIRNLDFFDMKGIVEGFVREYSGKTPVFQPVDSVHGFHPKKTCHVVVDGETVGFMGEIHPEVLKQLKLPVGACGFEISCEGLWPRRQLSAAGHLPEYPPMNRDVALMVDESQDAGPIGGMLLEQCGSLATDIRLFDIYRGKGIPEGKKSLAFSIVFQSKQRTLTDEEVDLAYRAAVNRVTSYFGASLR